MARAIETVRTKLTLGQTNRLDESIYGIELQRGQIKALAYLLHHALILRRTGRRILVEVLAVISLKLLDNATGEQLHHTLR